MNNTNLADIVVIIIHMSHIIREAWLNYQVLALIDPFLHAQNLKRRKIKA